MESQCVEWKESWHDEHLKCICAFANAQGGRLEIGRNDKGVLVGLPNAKRLLDELPNKIRTTMGIVADVRLLCENGIEYIAVDIAAHQNAISYRGRHYMRSGSSTLELTGFALDELILRKYGRTWDSAPVPCVSVSDFYNDAFDIFRKKAISSERLASEDVSVSNELLLKFLKLTDGDYLLKAALMVFHQDPEQWCFGSQVKIAYFENDADIRYQDEIRGPLIGIADRVIDLIYTKYFKGLIHYNGIQRIDKFPMPRDVLREAVLNAIVHKDYNSYNPIHIKIYDDKVVIYNNCQIPPHISPENLLQGNYGSIPHNPLIAGAFFRSGQIESWGRGIEKMKRGCVDDGLPEPEFTVLPNLFTICFHTRNNAAAKDQEAGENFGINDERVGINDGSVGKEGKSVGINGECVGKEVKSVGIKETQTKILNLMIENPDINTDQIAALIGITRRRVESNIRSLKNHGLVDRVGGRKKGQWVVKT